MKKPMCAYSAKTEFMPFVEKIEDPAIKNYIRDRVLGQICWYDEKASINQRSYRISMVISIALSAVIPVLTLLLELPFGFAIKIAITSLSAGVTVISAVNALYKFRELWVQYRSNCEVLISILYRYFSKIGEFEHIKTEQANKLLAEICEDYFAREYQIWATRISVTEKALNP
jgi:hypothetical protein